MLYQQSYPITNKLLNADTAGSTSTSSIMDGGCTLSKPGNAKTKSATSLPSFNELLTSIPLPNEFKPATNNTKQGTSPTTVTSPYSYYMGPPVQHRLPTPPPYPTSSPTIATAATPLPQHSPYLQPQQTLQQPQPYHQQYYNYQYAATSASAVAAPPPYPHSTQVSSIPPPPLPTTYHQRNQQPVYQQNGGVPIMIRPSPGLITPTSTTFDHAKIRSNSTGNISNTTSSQSKDPRRKHVCKVCSRSFTTSGHLARHNRIHTGERKHQCPWPTCEARFARQDNCNQHYKTHTNGKNKRNRQQHRNVGSSHVATKYNTKSLV
ncbi:transcriptional regulator, putative [Candida dubliniensis CD36]|uniref:Transcriptional regulator, putative n=1 Tax=Candida dubliniensis (strain CD36 / ATCC MYA-646 / CBS 7987 / NCPF 3949 / NRRL Y-17841) TaxID=573826 RepID=B9WJY2_CANDC|nr:transcriptional regulator, putative [Candida dubliniensis CD36]CAX40940.1 transcriptional regulator, putative [Candida dubliniensis CD36]